MTEASRSCDFCCTTQPRMVFSNLTNDCICESCVREAIVIFDNENKETAVMKNEEPKLESGPRLYKVIYTVTSFCLAKDECDALSVAREALGDADPIETGEAERVGPHTVIDGGWDENCLVYVDGREEIKLGAAWPKED